MDYSALSTGRITSMFQQEARKKGFTIHGDMMESRSPDGQAGSYQQGDIARLVALVVKQGAVRCRDMSTGKLITLRPHKNPYDLAAGEIITVKTTKNWTFKNTVYLSGNIESRKIAIDELGLTPLALQPCGTWDPGKMFIHSCEYDSLYRPIIDTGQRPSFRLEDPLGATEEYDSAQDFVSMIDEWYETGQADRAGKALEKLLLADFRVIDAHLLMGDRVYALSGDWSAREALRHYQVGIAIGQLTLGDDFNGVLPWNELSNQAYLTCLFHYGLACERLKDSEEAARAFTRLLWLDPSDPHGAAELLMDKETKDSGQRGLSNRIQALCRRAVKGHLGDHIRFCQW